MDDLSQRVTRLEDALADFATLVTEATIARPSFFVGSAAKDAGRRFAAFISAVQRERAQAKVNTSC